MYTMVETSIKSSMQKSSTQTGESEPLGGKGNAPTQAEVKSKSLAPSQQRLKRPINSFLMWSQPERKKMLDKYPKMRNSEISKKLGANWKCLTDAQKKPFINEAKRLRVKYMSEYPGSKYAPRRKSKKIQITGQYSMPAFTQGQLGYIQNPSINMFPFQHTQRYGMRYGYMLAPPQAYMSPAPIYNISVPYAPQTSGIMNLGSTASGTESDSNSSLPITPHRQKLYTSDMRDATSMPLSGDV